jgi:hypothetical protein
MEYNTGETFGYDQYYSNPAYLENPVATTSELLKRNREIAQSERPKAPYKTIQEQEIEDIIQQEIRDKVRRQVEKYFDNKNGEVDYPNTFKNRKMDTFQGGFEFDDNYQRAKQCLNSMDSSSFLMILVVIMFILSIFQYTQLQSLHAMIHRNSFQMPSGALQSPSSTSSVAKL